MSASCAAFKNQSYTVSPKKEADDDKISEPSMWRRTNLPQVLVFVHERRLHLLYDTTREVLGAYAFDLSKSKNRNGTFNLERSGILEKSHLSLPILSFNLYFFFSELIDHFYLLASMKANVVLLAPDVCNMVEHEILNTEM